MAVKRKRISQAEAQIEGINAQPLDQFVKNYLPPDSSWSTWTHAKSATKYSISLYIASSLNKEVFNACFNLIKSTSGADYKASSVGWKPTAKKREMRSDDLKYLVVRPVVGGQLGDGRDGGEGKEEEQDEDDEKDEGEVMAFMSFMPTMEDGVAVVYLYEIHAVSELQGSGLGSHLMGLLEGIARKMLVAEKVVLSCFVRNKRAVRFYEKRGYVLDEFSPQPRKLRTGAVVEPDYVTMSLGLR